MPRRTVSNPQTKVVRLTFSTGMMKLINRECRTKDIEPGDFLRELIRKQQGKSDTGRPAKAKKPRPLPTTKQESVAMSLYVSEEMFEYLDGLANSAGINKKSVLSALILDYFEIFPIKFANPATFE